MKVQERFMKQYSKAMQMHFAGRSHSQILTMLQDGFIDAVSARTLTYWIADFKTWDKEAISREAPFELHLIEEYGLPIEATQYIAEVFYTMNTMPSLPMFPSTHIEWKPTVREVDWWWRVHNMADDFSHRDVYLMATHYAVRELLEKVGGIPPDYSDLNAFMTYQPWRSMDRTERYQEAIEEGKFTEISTNDYGDRGIIDAEGEWAIDLNVGILWMWTQMNKKKYLSPYKAVMMRLAVETELGEGLPFMEDEDDVWVLKPVGGTFWDGEEVRRSIWNDEEIEDIREFIEEARNES